MKGTTNHFIGTRAIRRSMADFSVRIDRLTERLRRDTEQCDLVEQRACQVEERLSSLHESAQALGRLIEVSLLILISSDKDKFAWLSSINDERQPLTDPIVEQFFYRLESYLRRSIIDRDEKQAYIQAFVLVRKPSTVSSRFFSK